MLRPRDRHDLRLASTLLTVSPSPQLRWLHDVFGKSVAVETFDEPATELRLERTLRIDR